MNKSDIVLFGAPASGKGSLAKLLVKNDTDFVHLSTGEKFREHIGNKTELGLEIIDVMNSGELVNDELTIAVVEDFIESYKNKRIIFDGFPRSSEQLIWLMNYIYDTDRQQLAAISLTTDDSILFERIAKRRKSEDREEDNDTVFKKRLVDYKKYQQPLVEDFMYYNDSALTIEIDANEPDINKVFRNTRHVLDAYDKEF